MCHASVRLLLLLSLSLACSSDDKAKSDAGTDASADANRGRDGDVSLNDGSVITRDAMVFPEGQNPCESLDNPPGAVQRFTWPAPSNTGNTVDIGATLRFEWQGRHNVVQVADWNGSQMDPGWELGIHSGEPSNDGTFDWNVGGFPCGYRPGLYYFADKESSGVTAVSLTEPEFGQDHFDPKPCSELAKPEVYGGRYAVFADRPGCRVFEVNNFQTETHYDWVDPVFAARQGDIVVFRWTGYHNIVQVHDVHEDELFASGGVYSGPKTNCVGGPNYQCANGPASLGEHVLDTQNWRPGIIHISDECAYQDPECPTTTGPSSGTGMNMQFRLSSRRQEPEAGSCCAIDSSKGQACRLIDLYNDNEGSQFEYNSGVNRGDLVRLRWSGALKVVQVEPNGDGSPSDTPKSGGIAMNEAVDCVPGPDGRCLGTPPGTAELIIDVDQALQDGDYHDDNGTALFVFKGYGENEPGYSSQDTGFRVYVQRNQPYDDNPPCP